MGNDWRDFWRLCRTLPAVLRAQLALGNARRLRRRGQIVEAFRVAIVAFGCLQTDELRDTPWARSIVATGGVLLDELAQAVGDPSAVRGELCAALHTCEEAVREFPNLERNLGRYITWYKHRLSEVPEPAAHR